jgi:hypothetical protein
MMFVDEGCPASCSQITLGKPAALTMWHASDIEPASTNLRPRRVGPDPLNAGNPQFGWQDFDRDLASQLEVYRCRSGSTRERDIRPVLRREIWTAVS